MNTRVEDIKAATPLTDEEYAEWRGNIEAFAKAESGEWERLVDGHLVPYQKEPESDPEMTTTIGIQLRLFATIDDLLAQLEAKEKTIEAVRATVYDPEDEFDHDEDFRPHYDDPDFECRRCRLDRILEGSK